MSRPTDFELASLLQGLASVVQDSATQLALEGFGPESHATYAMAEEALRVASQLKGQDA
jgi:hypothetical protein